MTHPPAASRRAPLWRALGALVSMLLATTLAASPAGAADAPRFYNPVLAGADPSIVAHDGAYYSVSSDENGVWVRKSTSLTTMAEGTIERIWTPAASGPLCCNVWAPEIQFIDGSWYIYFAADDGQNENHRMYGITALTDDPQGPWSDPVKLAPPTDRWAIDGTVLQDGGDLYFVWSGWEGTTNVDQRIYLAPMSDPLTVSGERVALSQPTEPWERVGLPIQEGPEVLHHNGTTTIVYSASGSWTEDYCLGTLTAHGGAVADPASWTKSNGCVFAKRDTAWGPGHATFTSSPDGTEDWIVYHASTVKDRGWAGRSIRAQKFSWNGDGTPALGAPVATYDTVPLPSGDRTTSQTTYEAEDAVVHRASIVDVVVPGASGHKKVGYIDYSDSNVEFDQVQVPHDGTYRVHVRYSNGTGSTSTHLLTVNGGPAQPVELPSNGWDNWLFASADVQLHQGTNSIRLAKGDGYAELDLIRVDDLPIGWVDPQEPVDDGATAPPATGMLSSNNGWDTGLRDGDYTISMNLWWGENASTFRLFENGTLISTSALSPATPAAQRVDVPIAGRVNGTYVYTGELVNSRGTTPVGPLTVAVTDAAPGTPVLSHDNWDGDGTFTLTADLWWGTNATSYEFREGGTVLATGSLVAATPGAQRATAAVVGAASGTHTYTVTFGNGQGSTTSAPVTVTVRR